MKVYSSIKNRPINAILIAIVIILYFINNLYLKGHTTGLIQLFFICYFNDLICPLFFLSYSNLLLITVEKEIKSFWGILLYCIISGFIWEFFAPVLKTNSITDIIDIIFYEIGAFVYWILWRFCK